MSTPVHSWIQGLRGPAPDELEVKALLRAYGVPTPPGVRVEPGRPLPDLPGDGPWAVKVCSGEILHKTDLGGVALAVATSGLSEVVAAMGVRFPGEDLLVEAMVSTAGAECIVGALVDPEFGTAVMAGAGGVLTELYRDVSFRLAPLSPAEAERMLRELQIAPLFDGFRGSRLDGRGLAEVVCAVGRLAADLGPRLDQLDVNPVAMVGPRWVALDAKLVLVDGPGTE